MTSNSHDKALVHHEIVIYSSANSQISGPFTRAHNIWYYIWHHGYDCDCDPNVDNGCGKCKYRLEGISIHNISASIHVLSRDILNCSALYVMKFMHGIIALILCHFLNHPIFHVIKWIAKGDPFIVPITRTYGCAFATSLHSHMAQIVGIDNYRTGSGGLMT